MIVRSILVTVLFCLLALLVFGPVINGELISVDDPDQIHSLQKRDVWNLQHTFVRKKTTGMYYRPLITLSFTADKLLWNADLRAMHLVNIFLHTLNALLVVLLTRFLIGCRRYGWHFSLLGGVLFLWHPLTTESVNWISGRTDILAATLVFSSALALLQFKKRKKWGWLLLSVVFAIGGVLAKETAIAFLAGFGFLLWAQTETCRLNIVRIIRRLLVLAGLLTAGGGFAWWALFQLRQLVLKDDSSRIALTIRVMDSDWYYSLFVCLRTLGFYLKKIFLPWPLNFAIIEVDPLYELLAMPLLLLLVYLFVKRSLVAGYVFTAAVLVSPAFVIAFNQIAWTPYAERYVYISLGFVAPVIAGYLMRLMRRPRICVSVCTLLVMVFCGTTAYRSWQWTTNEALWGNTVAQSPLSEKSWNNYGVALLEQGRYAEAEKCFVRAAARYKFGYQDKYDINIAISKMKRHDYSAAIEQLLLVIERSNGNSTRAVDTLFEIAAEPWKGASTVVLLLRNKLESLSQKTGKPAYLYQLGRLEQYLEHQKGASDYFQQAYVKAEESDPIKKKAKKALVKIVSPL